MTSIQHVPQPTWPSLRLRRPQWHTALTSRAARLLFVSAMKKLDVTVQIESSAQCESRTIGRGGPLMRIHRPDEFFHRLGRDHLIGFGEAYMTGAWDAPDVAAFLEVLAARVSTLIPRPLQALREAVAPATPRNERGDKADTRRVIGHHYDLSNDLFATFLDPTMTYSAALFDESSPGIPVVGADLEQAQVRKIDRLLDLAQVGDGTELLEIGSGWGALAMRAAERGAKVRTLTLSTEQQQLARERIEAAGLSGQIDVDLCDYRDVDGSYDAVVSVEMIEAVGWRHWDTYFATIDRVLRPGGKAAIQAITMPHGRMKATRNTYTWVMKYIFPGGFLPSVEALRQAAGRSGLVLESSTAFGRHYAETLRQWDEAFAARAERVGALGFDATFRRMWHFYLAYCRAGFAAGYIDDHHLTFAKAAR